MKRVDVVVGGQYGDEGKGVVALQLALSQPYAALVRTGAHNAEHRVRWKGQERGFHVLPVAILTDPPPSGQQVILPAGMTFGIDMLMKEITGLGDYRPNLLHPRRLVIDRNAGIVTSEFVAQGQQAAKERGSTFLGVGATMAAKVRRHGFKVAKDYPELGPYLSIAADKMHEIMMRGGDILVEASQGTLLSLDHGHYPFCTSRNVTAMGALSDAGLNWQQVRDVWMVVKALPMRVPGPSGPTAGRELSWEEACKRAGRPFEEIRQTATETGAGGLERPFEFDLDEVIYATKLNGPTAIVLTFLDWICYDDLGATQLSELSKKSKTLISQIQDVTGVPVKFVRTGPELEHFIWIGGQEWLD